MKRKVIMACMAIMAAGILTACSQSDSGESTAGSGSSSVTSSGTTTGKQSAAADSTAGSAAGDSADTVQYDRNSREAGQEEALDGLDENNSVSGDASSDGTVTHQEEVVSTETEETIHDEENYSDKEFNELSSEGESEETVRWTGTYSSSSTDGDTVTITSADAEHISFTFMNAGIYGQAEVKGTQAIYHGDDYNVIVFDYVDDAIEVSVASEEDYDAEDSPLNGTYTRQQ